MSKLSLSRRNILKAVAGGGVSCGFGAMVNLSDLPAAEAAALAVPNFKGGEFLDKFAGNVLCLPGKFSGNVNVLDMAKCETLAWFPFGLLNIDMPIPHHLASMPSENAAKGFDFYVTMQPPESPYVNEMSPEWRNRGTFGMWKMRFDGSGPQNRISMVNDIAATTGLALGVHTSIGVGPNANKYVSFADGQKDMIMICTVDDNPKFVAAMKFDYDPVNKQLIISRMFPGPSGKFDLLNRKGCKTTHEAMLGEELMPADPTAVFVDAFTWHPELPLGTVLLRRLGATPIIDTKTWTPLTVMGMGSGSPDHYKLVRQQGYTWVYSIPTVPTPLHEAGFVTDGRHYVSCNNVLENSNTVVESGDSDPLKWRKKTIIQGYGKTHLPLHMGNLPNSKYVYFTAWARPPLRGYIAKVSTETWQILQKIDIGPDPHTCEPTIDGKYMTAVYSGNQGGESGIVVLDVETDEIVMRYPDPGGHHDHSLVPKDWEGMKASRSTNV